MVYGGKYAWNGQLENTLIIAV